VQTTGDGFLVVFDNPARAVRAAAAMLDTATNLSLTARAGIHTGEIELQGDDIRGIAVHATARILALAEPGQVVVSGTVRDILAGSGMEFTDLGEHELRGLEGRRTLAALVR
jgi:class 3 adenylate cyclase